MVKSKAAVAASGARLKKKAARRRVRDKGEASSVHGPSFPIVAIGASAGGLAAFTALLKALPSRSGTAFVLIQHLEPSHESALTTLLSKTTSMPVVEVFDGITVEPSHVYVIPPNKSMTIRAGRLRLTPRSNASVPQRPIDDFSIALAEEQGNRAIGVVLSGTGSDGTYGLKAIKAAGGVTFAQDPRTAQWPGMPLSAVAAGSADFVLSPKRIAAELARLGRHPYVAGAGETPDGSDLDKVSLSIRNTAGVDFRLYKQPTVLRRIARRMALQKIPSLTKYAQVLKQNRDEAQALADDIFIHVTSFFRDVEAFQALRKTVLAKLCAKRVDGDSIRVWVAGCSTGEEVYSIAMLLLEELAEPTGRVKIQIFGSDLQDRALDHARVGIYSEAAIQGVSPARLKRFFVESDHGYQIRKFVRDLCVFARHDLAKDPPFSRMDLVSCRNVLIYMGPALQKMVMSVFQYALKPGGFLFLGKSESITGYSEAFATEDQKHRIFARKLPPSSFREHLLLPDNFREPAAATLKHTPPGAADFRRIAEETLLEHYAPAALIVDPDFHIVHFQGDIGPYLAPATGNPTFQLLKMVRPEFVVDLRTILYNAKRDRVAVHKDPVPFEHQGRPAAVRLEVRPIQSRNGKKPDFLVVFQRVAPTEMPENNKGGKRLAVSKRTAENAEKLERELASTREHLRVLIAEHDTVQEEMKAANEEILSSNEELQSTNEELETAKEELQSSNEELITLNEELQHRNSELSLLMQDLNNLLVGVDVPVLVLDGDLRVRRFTPVAGALFNLIPGDVGRPFSNIASSLNIADWNELFSEVTKQERSVEREVSDRKGHRYSMRIRPYKTGDNQTDGVLVVMFDVELIYRSRDAARESADYALAVFDTVNEALVIVDASFEVRTVNKAFCRLFQVSPEAITARPFFGPGTAQLDSSRFRQLLSKLLSKNVVIAEIEIDQEFPEIGRRRLIVKARQIGASRTILIAIEDITQRKQAQEDLQRREATIRSLLEAAPQSVLAIRPDETIALTNGNTEKMFGYKREELLGQRVDILIPEGLRERHADNPRTYFADPRSRPMGHGLELEARRKDGTSFPVEVALSAIETAAGNLVVAFVSDITERRQFERTREMHAQQMKALAARLMTDKEEERRRVSRELHDGICQQLAALAMDIGGLAIGSSSQPGDQDKFKSLQKRVVRASEEARHIAYQLHPSMLEDLGLAASLRALCKEFSDLHPNTTCEVKVGAMVGLVPREVVSGVFRIAQESLNNVVKHSKAKHVSIALGVEKDVVEMTITDDGIGFDKNAIRGRGGLGLIGAEERARLLNGTFTVKTELGRGVEVKLRIALQGKSQ